MTKKEAAAYAIHSLFGLEGTRAWDLLAERYGIPPEIVDRLVEVFSAERKADLTVRAAELQALAEAEWQEERETVTETPVSPGLDMEVG